MVEIGGFDVGGGAISDGPDVRRQRLCVALVEALVTFTQGFRGGTRERFAGLLRYGLGESVCFRVLDVKARGSFFLYHLSTFLYPSRFPDSWQGSSQCRMTRLLPAPRVRSTRPLPGRALPSEARGGSEGGKRGEEARGSEG